MSSAYTSLSEDASGSYSSASSAPLLTRAPTRPLAPGLRPYGDSSHVSSGDSSPTGAGRHYAPLAGADRNQTARPFSYADNTNNTTQPQPKPQPQPQPHARASAAPAPAPAPAPATAPAPARAAAAAAAAATAAPSSGLACQQCTFLNSSNASRCNMCNSPLRGGPSSQSTPPTAIYSQSQPRSNHPSQPQTAYSPQRPQPPQQQYQPQYQPYSHPQPAYAIPIQQAPRVVYVQPAPNIVMLTEATLRPCCRCGKGYPLPYGATSWRCTCGNFNSLAPDQCNIM